MGKHEAPKLNMRFLFLFGALARLGSTDEAASLNEVSTLPGMQNAPYLGTWVMKDKGIYFDQFLQSMNVNIVMRMAAKLLTPTLVFEKTLEDNEPKLAVSLEGPFKMKAETKLSLTPSKCDDIAFFGEQMNVCAEETITKNMQVKVTLPSENIEMKILFTKFDSSLRAELDSSAANYVMTFKFDKK